MVLTLASAVDLVGIDDVYHGKRVAMMAAECAKHLGWDEAAQGLLFDAGMLHDCGVSSTREHRKITDEIEWENVNLHCELGYARLQSFAPLSHLAPIVRYHHTRWEVLRQIPIDPRLALHANLIFMVDRVDAQALPYYADDTLLMHAGEIRDAIGSRRDKFFAPDLVDAFLQISAPEAFWLQLDPAYIPQYVAHMAKIGVSRSCTLAELKEFAYLTATIVDAKSPYTSEHSLGVARIARYLARLAGMSGEHLEKLEIAALMHDIGKLQVSDELLESHDRFTAADRAIMKKHSFATFQILNQIGGFEEIAWWAAEHHESLNGSGYPFQLKGLEIPTEARIIKVADVFQALAQQRPYREPMSAPEILDVLRKMQTKNEVDGQLVDMMASHLDECHQLASKEALVCPH